MDEERVRKWTLSTKRALAASQGLFVAYGQPLRQLATSFGKSGGSPVL